MSKTLLIVDDEKSICSTLKRYFSRKGCTCNAVHSGSEAMDFCRVSTVDVILLDLKLPDKNGLEVLSEIKSIAPETGVVMLTAYGDIQDAVQAIKLGAENFLLKPVDLTILEQIVLSLLANNSRREEIHYLRKKTSALTGPEDPRVIRHPKDVYNAIQLLSHNPSTTVLLTGETGTGKGLVAQTIHELSDRRNNQFVDINCAGLRGELLTSELFGHEKGAFTDAKTMKRGLLEVSDNGSIFLDEVSEMPLDVQAMLLHVIETKSFRRLGGTQTIRVDSRIMAATNANLENEVSEGRFRRDLYYRLNVIPIRLPPLRERRETIPGMARDFLSEFCTQFNKKISGISRDAESLLCLYAWPGNIRELRNVIERAVILCEEEIVRPAHLPSNFQNMHVQNPLVFENDNTLATFEREHIRKILTYYKGNRTKTALCLGIHRSTLINKIELYGL